MLVRNQNYKRKPGTENWLGSIECSHIVENDLTGERIGIELCDIEFCPRIAIISNNGFAYFPLTKSNLAELSQALNEVLGWNESDDK